MTQDNGIAMNAVALDRLQHFNPLHVIQGRVQPRGIRYAIVTKRTVTAQQSEWTLSPIMTVQSTQQQIDRSENIRRNGRYS